MSGATFSCPDLDSFCRLDRLGLTVTGQQVGADRTVLACRVVEPDDWCHGCGGQGVLRDTVERRLAHVPLGWRPTTLAVRVRRYACTGCGHVWRQDVSAAVQPRARLSRDAVLWALRAVVVDRLSITRVASGLGVSWHTANTAVLAAGRELLVDDPARLEGVAVIGVDEHCWRHPRHGAGRRRALRHGDHRSDSGARRHRPPRGCWTWFPVVPRPCSPAGWTRRPPRSATGSRSSRWTGSPGPRPPPARPCRPRPQ